MLRDVGQSPFTRIATPMSCANALMFQAPSVKLTVDVLEASEGISI